ncbi:MAG: glycosyltransferase family 39 protein [Isosphaeraceae bacterium]
MNQSHRTPARAFAVVMLALLVFQVWLRGHAFWPTVRPLAGFDPYFVTSPEAEPLDCDEAIYGYIGGRLARGSVMYRDLTENKPPGGYWIFATAVSLGGPHELTIHLLPLPFVLATTLMVGWIARKVAGNFAGCLASFVAIVVSTDPFLYGESANMEHLVNTFSIAALATWIRWWNGDRSRRGGLIATGALVALAALVKQTAILQIIVFGAVVGLRVDADQAGGRGRKERALDGLALVSGLVGIFTIVALILVWQGASRAAFEDIVWYGSALARETPPPPNAPHAAIRWLTGNAAPDGQLPWPFGSTRYLVWWGTGTWPIWLASLALLFTVTTGRFAESQRRVLAGWTLIAMLQVVLPGLYWQHYYLLPVPGLALLHGVGLTDQLGRVALVRWRAPVSAVFALTLLTAIGWTIRLQVREYLLVRPVDLVQDRGGPQWLANRALGRALAQRTRDWPVRPTLFVWGWQGPLYFYSDFDCVTPQVFVDDFLRAFADQGHAQATPRIERTMRDLRDRPPTFLFVAYPPFDDLRSFMQERYVPSILAAGLWVDRRFAGAFESAVGTR